MIAQPAELKTWWNAIPALPIGTSDQAYYALRRVWGDHTIAGTRSFYRWGSEDNITPALFQNWAIFPDPNSIAPLVRAAGGSVGTIKRCRWGYACEETLDVGLRQYHGRDFVIPDIVVKFEDEQGIGLLVFEIKKPGKATDTSDGRKLATYCDLPSMRQITRRFGCLLVSAAVAEKSARSVENAWPVVIWEQVAEIQRMAARTISKAKHVSDHVAQWVGRSFTRYGIHVSDGGAPVPWGGTSYGSNGSYDRIDELALPDGVGRFLKGSEYVEAFVRGETAQAPLPWLSGEPTALEVRARRLQSTQDRRIRRWDFNWSPMLERSWR